MYEGVDPEAAAGTRESSNGSGLVQKQPIQAEHTDPTLQHPRCVFQILKRHFSRYTPEMVDDICGIPPALFLKVAETLCRNSGRERTAAFCYAVGLDAAFGGRAIYPHARHHSIAARQHGTAGRRHHGPARPRFHPRLHRYPDPLQPAARLSADAQGGARQGFRHLRSS